MRTLGLLIAIFIISISAKHPVRDDIVDAVNNNPASTWKAKPVNENKFAHMPEEQIKGLLGAKFDNTYSAKGGGGGSGKGKPTPAPEPDVINCAGSVNEAKAAVANNSTFDARTHWPGKIHPIRDQGYCGSCWAYGSSNAYTDRRHILTGEDIITSPQFLIDCNLDNYGCNGGYLSLVWDFIHDTGIPSETCQPETSAASGVENSCSIDSCTGSSGESFVYYHSGPTCGGSTLDVAQIKQQMMTKGPVESGFVVYEDFMSYSSGVYKHQYGSYLGGHAIKCFGWGYFTSGSGKKTRTYEYWMCANQWGTDWGDNGYFNILMGDCGIDDQVYFAEALAETTTV